MSYAYWELLPEDFSESQQWRTTISTFETGKEQRRAEWTKPKIVYSFSYPNAIENQITELWDFYQARKGAFEKFYLAVPPYLYHTESVVGATFVVLSEATKPSPSNITVYLDDKTIYDWHFSEDNKTIHFDEAKTGEIAVRYVEMKLVRFLNDSLDRDWFVYLVTRQTIDFITV